MTRPRLSTFAILGSIRYTGIGWPGTVIMLTISRRGYVWTMLTRDGKPIRSKHWTAKRAHRHRVRRLRERLAS